MKNILFILSIFMLASAAFSQTIDEVNQSKLFLKSNLEFLASDIMEGREATTRAEDLAASFISSELQKYGVKPFGESYLQKIPVRVKRIQKDSELYIVSGNNEKEIIKPGEGWVTQPNNYDISNKGKEFPLVFAGYGLEAPEYNYNDYEDIDVNGKIVVALWGEPQSEDENFFNGPKPSKYMNPHERMKSAAQRGAKGMILVPDEGMMMYWKYMKRMLMISEVSILQDEMPEKKALMPGAIVSSEVLNNMFDGEEYSFENIRKMESEGNLESFDLSKKMSMYINTKSWDDEIENVVGFVEGNDEQLKNEYIIIGAHYDHDGTWEGEVYNGADDNGSGTVAIMEVLRRLNNAGLRRSVIGVLFAGEEKGLLGSKYFAENCEFKENISAMINIDMCGREAVDTMVTKAAQETSKELDEIIKALDVEMESMALEVEPGINSPMGTSDHASFAAVGIPAVYFGDKMRVDLHLPSDDIEKIDYEKIFRTTTFIEKLVQRIDELDHKVSREK